MLKILHEAKPTPTTYKVGEQDLIRIGPHSYASNGLNVDWWSGKVLLSVGSYCSIADNVTFLLNHERHIDCIASYPFSRNGDYWLAGRKPADGTVDRGDIEIGSDVSIGNGARILPGVRIGHGAVVDSGAVVTANVPPYAFVAGNPARIMHYRFAPELIEELLQVAWWNWPEEKVRTYLDVLLGSDFKRLKNLTENGAMPIQGALVPAAPPSLAAVLTEMQGHLSASKFPEALAVGEAALARGVDDVGLMMQVVQLHLHLGKNQEAWNLGQQVLARTPENTDVHFQLGLAGMRINRYEDALTCFRKVLDHSPNSVEARTNLAAVYFNLGFIQDSLAQLEKALKLAPNLVPVWQNYMSILNYDEDAELARVMERHREAGRRITQAALQPPASYDNDRSPDRQLRIGYLSGDFFNHPASHYIEPVLRGHDRAHFDVYAYSLISWSDPITQAFRNLVPNWRDVGLLSDDALFHQIQADRIDILVDLSGHTARNRVLLMARKPAPVMVNWIGYLNTMGMKAFDYALLDPHLLSPAAEENFVETPYPLPHTAYCYTPLIGERTVAPFPWQTNGHITFGCFNNPAKLSRSSIAAWAAILKSVPDSRLLFKYKTYDSAMVQRRVLDAMAGHGITAERIVFEGFSPLGSFLDTFGAIDIALDSFPYTGVTTTMHTLFMGVPVITLVGHTPMQRFGRTALTAIGRPDWIANTPEEYVAIAVRTVAEVKVNPGLRQEIQDRMCASPMMRHDQFVRDLEAAYRGMWHRWNAIHDQC